MTNQPKHPHAALVKRLHKFIESLERDRERMQAQKEQDGFSPTLDDPIWEYGALAKRLSKRLAGNPRTLRRRLGTLKRQLAKRQRTQKTLQGMEQLGERRRQEAALLADVLGTLVGKLEETLRPGLARQQPRLAAPPLSGDQPPLSADHTPVCLAYQAQQERQAKQRQTWFTRWYRFCRACQGTGRIDESDPAVGLNAYADCEHCTAQGICPRCGQKALIPDPANDSYKGPCLECWFWFGEGEGHEDDLPPPADEGPGCICPKKPFEPPPLSEEELGHLVDQEYDPDWQREQNQRVLRRHDR